MSRGLSKLQRFILEKAARQPRVYYAEILAEFFGWKSSSRLPFWKRIWDRTADGNLASPGMQRFSPKEIGVRRYRAAQASLSRACTRLEARQLVTLGARSHWSVVEITDKGREFLSVNSAKP
jgi:hypothetical protein